MEQKRKLYAVGIIAGVCLGFKYLFLLVLPFLAGWMLALGIYPAAVKAERNFRLKRSIAGSALLLLLFGAAGALLWWGVKEGLSQAKIWIAAYPKMEAYFFGALRGGCGMLERGIGIRQQDSYEFLMQSVGRMQRELQSGIGTKTIGWAALLVGGSFRFAGGVLLTALSSLFILRDMEKLRRGLREYAAFRGIGRVLHRLRQTTAVYVKAELLIMLVISGICTAGFWLLRSPYYLLLGVGIGLLDALPLIGTGLFLYPAALLYFLNGSAGLGAACLALEFLTSVVREVLEPRLLGKKLGVCPVVILAAVYFGMVFYGPMGVFLGPLSLSLIYEIGKEWDIW